MSDFLQHIYSTLTRFKSLGDFNTLANELVDHACDAGLNADALCVYLIDAKTRQGRNYFFRPTPVGWNDLEFDETMAPWVAHAEQSDRVWREENADKPLWYGIVPTPLGVIEISTQREPDDRDRNLLAHLADPLQLFAQRHRDLEQLEQLTERASRSDDDLQALLDGSCAFAGDNADEIAHSVVHVVTDQLAFDRAGVFLVDERAALLRGTWGIDTEGKIAPIARTAFPLHRKHREQLSEAARIALGELDYFLTRDLDGEGLRSLEGHITSNLAVPMRVGRRIVGVLSVDNYFSRRPIGEHQVQPLMVLANQAAAKLENIRLQHKLRTLHDRHLDLTSPVSGTADANHANQPISLDDIVAASELMRRVLHLACTAAQTDYTVLITGETGTGKDLIARAIHAQSPRKDDPLVTVNSASLSTGLEDSELFGHVKGAFTSAHTDSDGLVAAADGGTLFLDEIGDLSTASQAKILRCLETGEVRRVGEAHVRRIDTRFIAATNLDLHEAVAQGRFREDLLYRLNMIAIKIPPLRERPEDIVAIVELFVERLASVAESLSIAPEAMDLLLNHHWPGNVRQLDACLRRSSLMASGGLIKAKDLPDEIRQPTATSQSQGFLSLEEVEKQHILTILDRCAGDRRATEHLLGISRATLQRRLKQYGLSS